MYFVCYIDIDNTEAWCVVYGEDEMNVFVDGLVNKGIDEQDIHVFNADDEIQ